MSAVETTSRISIDELCVNTIRTFGWSRYVGPNGVSIGMTTFGASAPLAQLQQKFGFTVANVVAAAKHVRSICT